MVRAGGLLAELKLADRAKLNLWAAANHMRAGDFARARAIYERISAIEDPLIRLEAAVGYEDASWRPGLADSRRPTYWRRRWKAAGWTPTTRATSTLSAVSDGLWDLPARRHVPAKSATAQSNSRGRSMIRQWFSMP